MPETVPAASIGRSIRGHEYVPVRCRAPHGDMRLSADIAYLAGCGLTRGWLMVVKYCTAPMIATGAVINS